MGLLYIPNHKKNRHKVFSTGCNKKRGTQFIKQPASLSSNETVSPSSVVFSASSFLRAYVYTSYGIASFFEKSTPREHRYREVSKVSYV